MTLVPPDLLEWLVFHGVPRELMSQLQKTSSAPLNFERLAGCELRSRLGVPTLQQRMQKHGPEHVPCRSWSPAVQGALSGTYSFFLSPCCESANWSIGPNVQIKHANSTALKTTPWTKLRAFREAWDDEQCWLWHVFGQTWQRIDFFRIAFGSADAC